MTSRRWVDVITRKFVDSLTVYVFLTMPTNHHICNQIQNRNTNNAFVNKDKNISQSLNPLDRKSRNIKPQKVKGYRHGYQMKGLNLGIKNTLSVYQFSCLFTFYEYKQTNVKKVNFRNLPPNPINMGIK